MVKCFTQGSKYYVWREWWVELGELCGACNWGWKYEWLILNVVIKRSNIWVGIVYWARLNGSFFGIRYLYLWYNQTISILNDWVDGSRPCVVFFANLYCFHSHVSLAFGMVMRCRPLSSYMWATSNCVWMVSEFVSMSFSGLHSLIEICASGIIVVVSMLFSGEVGTNYVWKMFVVSFFVVMDK
jgi:hypothetical protein